MSRPVVQDPLEALRGAIVRPAATPQDTFIQPVMQPGGGGSSSGLAAGLAGLSKGLSAYAKYQEAIDLKAQEAKAKEDLAAGEMAFHRSQARLQDAVRDGTIRPGMSPMFKDGYLTAMLEEQGYQYQTALEQAYAENPGQFEDPDAFAAWENQVFNSYGESQWANSEATDRQIIENFMPIRKKVRNEFRNKVLNRRAEELEAQRFSLFEQQTTRAYAAFQAGQLSTEDAGALISRLGEQLYQSAPSKAMGKEINKVLLNQLYHVAISKMDPKVLALARHVRTGTGTLAGTGGYRDSVEKTRKEIESRLKALRAAGGNAVSVQDMIDLEMLKDPKHVNYVGSREEGIPPSIMSDKQAQELSALFQVKYQMKPKAANRAVAKIWKSAENERRWFGKLQDKMLDWTENKITPTREDADAMWPYMAAKRQGESPQEHAQRVAGLVRFAGQTGMVPRGVTDLAQSQIMSKTPAEFDKGLGTFLDLYAQNRALAFDSSAGIPKSIRMALDAVNTLSKAGLIDTKSDDFQLTFRSAYIENQTPPSEELAKLTKDGGKDFNKNQRAQFTALIKGLSATNPGMGPEAIVERAKALVEKDTVEWGGNNIPRADLPPHLAGATGQRAAAYFRKQAAVQNSLKEEEVSVHVHEGKPIATTNQGVLLAPVFTMDQALKQTHSLQRQEDAEARQNAIDAAVDLNKRTTEARTGDGKSTGLGTNPRPEKRAVVQENKPTAEVEAARAARKKRLTTLEDKQTSLNLDLNSDLSIDELMEALGEELT